MGPNPKDNSLIRKQASAYEGFHSTCLQHCSLVKELFLGLGSLCLLLKGGGRQGRRGEEEGGGARGGREEGR